MPAIGDIAQSLSLTTVVEGIEDVATWRLVSRLGATYSQGFYIARPMPNADLIG